MAGATIKGYISKRISATLCRWMLSYGIVLALPVLFGGIIYGDALAREQKNVHRIQHQAMYSVQTYLEKELESLYQICYSLLNSRAVAALERNDGGEYTPEQILKVLEIEKQIANYKLINGMISELYLYLPKQDDIITNDLFCPLQDMKGFEQKRFGCSLEEFREKLVSTTFRGELRLLEDRLVYLYSIHSGEEQSVRVILYLDKHYIWEMMENEEVKLFLVFPDEKWIGMEEYSFLKAIQLVRRAEEEKQTFAKQGRLRASLMGSYWLMRDEEHFLLLQDSERYDLSYLIQVSRQEYQKTVNDMIFLLVIYIGACIMVGSALIYYLAKLQYLPLKELLQFVTRGKKKERDEKDEFVQIRTLVEELLEDYQQSQSELAENQVSVQNSYMNIMLKGYRKPELWEERLQEWIAGFCYKGFIVLGIELLELGKIWERKEPLTSQEYDLAVFAVESVLHELIEPFYPSVEAETEGMIFSVVNVPEDGEEEKLEQTFLKLVEELKEFFLQYYSIELAVSVSCRHYGLEGLPQCYRDISELLEYRNWNPKEYSASLFFSKVNVQQENGWRKESERLLQALEKHQIKEAVARFSELIAGISEELPQKEVQSSKEISEQQIEEISLYIQAHYGEAQLTVGAIAEQYGQNISTLSKQFKRWKGYGLLEYINLQRFERAKVLLAADTDYSIKEVAELVGFYDAQPLNRLFRKTLGMTPGEYKKMPKE
ncbi:MAG: AraC family transcriptional regulator [Lachnospiraceae bacterium]|jgi:AraC-like DNA-binding protein|nr:AraC family transcriptional regulator [Lachnospiraceae bacterium]